MESGITSNFTAMNLTVTSNFSAMNLIVTSNFTTMKSDVTSNFTAIDFGVKSNFPTTGPNVPLISLLWPPRRYLKLHCYGLPLNFNRYRYTKTDT